MTRIGIYFTLPVVFTRDNDLVSKDDDSRVNVLFFYGFTNLIDNG